METGEDKQWATKYLLDPLTAPEPSQETGPGSQFINTEKAKGPAVTSYPTPPGSASPSRSSFHSSNPFAGHRQQAFGEHADSKTNQRNSMDASVGEGSGKGRRRGSSLNERYPGDMSHRPLDLLRKEAKAANRSPHLKKRHIPGADSIDSLDATIGGLYHHEGPYDATLLARNTSYKSSPVEAVRGSNNEALRATPKEMIKDSLRKHVPLQGTAVVPPGERDMFGRQMNYEEGADLMREDDAPGGAYKRWDHVKYLPGDLKGKGEPSYSVEKALKDHKGNSHRRIMSDGDSAYEMQTHTRPGTSRQRSASGNASDLSGRTTGSAIRHSDFQESDMRRSNTTGGKIGEGLKKRFGSLRRSKKTTEA